MEGLRQIDWLLFILLMLLLNSFLSREIILHSQPRMKSCHSTALHSAFCHQSDHKADFICFIDGILFSWFFHRGIEKQGKNSLYRFFSNCSYSVAVSLLQIFALMTYTVQNAHVLFVEIFVELPESTLYLAMLERSVYTWQGNSHQNMLLRKQERMTWSLKICAQGMSIIENFGKSIFSQSLTTFGKLS